MKAPKLCQLKDLCIGKTTGIRQKDLLVKGEHPVYGASGIVGFSQRELHPKPYVVVVKDGAGVGRAFVAEGGSSILGTIQALIPKGNVDCRYLLYLVKSLRLGSERSGATIPHIYFNKYSHKLVPYYSKDHQKAIADSLRQIELLIEKRCGQRNGLYRLVQSRFIEMFGDHSAEMRSRWDCRPLGACVHGIETGKSPVCEGCPRSAPDMPAVLKLSALSSGRYLEKENKAIGSQLAFSPEKEVRTGDILMARKNTPELVGSCVLVDRTEGSMMFPDIVFRMHARDDVDAVYLVNLLGSSPFSKEIKKLAHGAQKSMSNISKTHLSHLIIPTPPLSLQREFAAFAESVDKSQEAARRVNRELLNVLAKSLYTIWA